MLSIQCWGCEAGNPISVLHLHVWLPGTILECCVSMCNFYPLEECLVENRYCWWCLWCSSWCGCLAAMLVSDVIMINVVSISVELYCLSTSYMCHLYYSMFAWVFLNWCYATTYKDFREWVYFCTPGHLRGEVLSRMPPGNTRVRMDMNLLASLILNGNNFKIPYLCEVQGIVFSVIYTYCSSGIVQERHFHT